MAHAPFLISDTFSLPPERLFALWTEPSHLQQWFGPAGMSLEAHTLDLRAGGRYHFAMKTASGQTMWGRWDFLAVDAPARLVWLHAFSDEQGGLTRHPMSPAWPLQLQTTVTFAPSAAGTELSLQWEPHRVTVGEQAVFNSAHDSMRMGWSGTFTQLHAYVARLSTAAAQPA